MEVYKFKKVNLFSMEKSTPKIYTRKDEHFNTEEYNPQNYWSLRAKVATDLNDYLASSMRSYTLLSSTNCFMTSYTL